jgi:hypothetical protein
MTAAASLFAWQSVSAAATTQGYQQVPLRINTTLVVDDKRMVGDGYSIDSVAVNDGYSNNYTLHTEVGEVRAVSDYELARKIQEVRALQILDAMSRAGVFGDAMKEGVVAPFRGAKALVTSPIQTTTGAVKGIGQWMGGIGRAVASDDPYQEGGVSAAVGWTGTKRAFALELGVDPYTEWKPLQDALSSVSRAAFAGGITVGVAMGAVTEGTTAGTAISVTSLSGEMNDILRDNPPEALTKLNRKKLKGMGISTDVIDPFLLNYNYTPTEKTLLVEALNRMDGAKGRELFIAQAAAAPDQVIARYTQQMAEMMANYHTTVGAADIVKIDSYVWLLNRKGTLVGTFPVDYLAWTEEASTIARGVERDPRAKTREIWLEGSASPQSSKALTSSGWTLKERVALLTGDALQDQTASGAGLGATTTAIGVMTP